MLLELEHCLVQLARMSIGPVRSLGHVRHGHMARVMAHLQHHTRLGLRPGFAQMVGQALSAGAMSSHA